MKSEDRTDPRSLPLFQEWASAFSPGHLGTWDFLSKKGGATLAIAFAALYWPRFIEIRGCVLLSDKYDPSNFDEWWMRLDGKISEVELTINHLHLWDLFDPQIEGVPGVALEELASIIAHCWKCALACAFPGRSFSVRKLEQEYGPTVVFNSVS